MYYFVYFISLGGHMVRRFKNSEKASEFIDKINKQLHDYEDMREYTVVFQVEGKLTRKSIQDIKDRILLVYEGDHYGISSSGKYIELKREKGESCLYCSLFQFIEQFIVFRDFRLNWSKLNQQ